LGVTLGVTDGVTLGITDGVGVTLVFQLHNCLHQFSSGIPSYLKKVTNKKQGVSNRKFSFFKRCITPYKEFSFPKVANTTRYKPFGNL
jgi:hypothetical protein